MTKLARRNLRKGRTHLEIVNLSQKYYIQTAFLEIIKENTEKVGIFGDLGLCDCAPHVEVNTTTDSNKIIFMYCIIIRKMWEGRNGPKMEPAAFIRSQ